MAAKWQMSFNVNKCKIMHIGKSEPKYIKDNVSNTHKIEQANQEKDLGVIFDKRINFQEHIKNKVNVANRNLGLIYKKFTYVDQTMFKQYIKH